MASSSPPPPRAITQEAFNEMVEENRVMFETTLEVALKDTVEELCVQKIDVSGLITTIEARRTWQDVQELLKQVKQGHNHDLTLLNTLEQLCGRDTTIAKRVVSNVFDTMMDVLEHLITVDIAATSQYEACLNIITSVFIKAFPNEQNPCDVKRAPAPPSPGMGENALKSWICAAHAMFRRNEHNKRLFHELGFNSIILHALTSSQNHSIIHASCRALRTFLSDDDRRDGVHPNTFLRARELGEDHKDDGDGVLGVLTTHLRQGAMSDVELCCVTCATLRAVAVNDLICNRAVFQHHALDVAFDLLVTHQDNARAVTEILALIRYLTRHDDAKRYVGKDTTRQMQMLEIWRQHLLTEVVCVEGANAVGIITLRQPDICDSFAEMGVATLLMDSLRAHGDSAPVQRAVFITVRNLVSHHTNAPLRKLFLDEGLIAVAIQARDKFPIECEAVVAGCMTTFGY